MGLKLEVYLDRSSSGLTTLRVLKSSLLQLLSGVLGSVFGLMSAFETAMSFTEKKLLSYRRSNKKANKKMRILRNLKSYIDFNKHITKSNLNLKAQLQIQPEAYSTTLDEFSVEMFLARRKYESSSGNSSPILPYTDY